MPGISKDDLSVPSPTKNAEKANRRKTTPPIKVTLKKRRGNKTFIKKNLFGQIYVELVNVRQVLQFLYKLYGQEFHQELHLLINRNK